MRIGIDGGCLANRRGFGRFARKLIASLAEAASPHEFIVVVDRPSLETVAWAIPNSFQTVVAEVDAAPSSAASATGSRSPHDLWQMGKAVAKAGLDLMYFPASYTFFPVWNVPRVVVTMHDTLALAYPDLVFPSRRGRLFWRIKEHAAVAWSDRIATVSESARRDLIAWFRLAPDRVVVVPEASDPIFQPLPADTHSDSVLAKYGIAANRGFILYVGGLSPHKNLPRLIEAFARANLEDTLLVLVGDLADVFHTHVPELRAVAERTGSAHRLILTGYIPDDELVHMYNRALFLAQPSLMEGFGLPPVEALACGTPVVYSTAGSLPEVVGDSGLSFDPTDIDAMAKVLYRMTTDRALRQGFAEKALRRAQGFSWSKTAIALLACFADLDRGAPRSASVRRSA